jgi:hypothetical protein
VVNEADSGLHAILFSGESLENLYVRSMVSSSWIISDLM